MKKLLCLMLAAVMLFSLAACTAEDAVEILDILLEDVETTTDLPLTTQTVTLPTDQTEPGETLPPETADLTEPEDTTPATEPEETVTEATDEVIYTEPALLDEHGTYCSKDEVALYILQYGHLPENYITKKAAEKLGWTGGSLEPYAPGKCIGGSRFGNYEGLLPVAEGRVYTECDIDTLGAKTRGAKRIVFSNDGLIFYTGDHYESFELLYGEVE